MLTKLAKSLDAKKALPPDALPPNLPPELPRVFLMSRTTVVQIALNRIEVRIAPPEHVAGRAESAIKYFIDSLNGVFRDLFNLAPRPDWSGAVLTVQYPSDGARSANMAIRPVFSQLVNVPQRDEDLTAFKLMFGSKHGDYFRHVTIQGYQTAEVLADVRSGTVDLSSNQATVTEAGVQLMLDVNDKPALARAGGTADLIRILQQLQQFCSEAPNALGLESILTHGV